MRFALSTLWAVSLFAGTGCGGKSEQGASAEKIVQVIEQKRPDLEGRLKAIDAIANRIRTNQTALTPLQLPDGVKLSLWSKHVPDPKANTLDFQLEGALANKIQPGFKISYGDWAELERVKSILAGDKTAADAYKSDVPAVQNEIDQLLKMRFLAVVEVKSVTLPVVQSALNTFTPGELKFRIHFFDLQEKKDLGILDAKSGNSEKMTVNLRQGDPEPKLKQDMVYKAGSAYSDALKPYQE